MEPTIISRLTVEMLATILEAELINAQSLRFFGVSTDSRKWEDGELFWVLKGERYDAHQFLGEVIAKGCRAIVLEERLDLPPQVVGFVVQDSLKAFARLAQALLEQRRALAPFQTYALTGSNGKTTTKEILATLLTAKGQKVLKTEGNLNNFIGLPMTVVQLREDHDVAVLELGANALGEIAYLSSIAKAEFSIITGVGSAHLGGFGSLEGVAKAKAEIMLNPRLKKLVLPTSTRQYYERELPAHAQTIWVGDGEAIWIENIEADMDGVRFDYIDKDLDWHFHLQMPLLGAHNAYNFAHAIAATRDLGWTEEELNAAIQNVILPSGRLERWDSPMHVLFLHDAYNANPSSMREAIALMTQLIVDERRCFILGDMAELGAETEAQHLALGKRLGLLGMKCLLCVGDDSRYIREGAIAAGLSPSRIFFTPSNDLETGLTWLASLFEEGDICLIKGSRSMKLERVLDYFEAKRH